jgi:5-methylcytosine-specific restriction endonuclease McrA
MSAHKLPDGQAAANKRSYNNKWRAENRQRVRDIEKARRLANPEPFKAAKKRHYTKNHDNVLAYAAAYRDANAELIKERCAGKYAGWSATYREKNPEKCRQMVQVWKDAHPEHRSTYNAQWTQNNLEKHRTYQHNRRARKAASGGTLSPDLAEKLYVLQKGKCACCRKPLGDDYHMDHIVPLVLGGSNTDDNIQLLTSRCNLQKGAKHPVEFMQARGLLL